ncbi:hypothetical protein [Geotalea toluenoxydans]|uniref:hypothetical protein n=1 Tax=Geotalea toluenoxydans TaxID=421624 RepID=UPI0006CFF1CB|nr:hypothetical protein [Geotalea toluenoxydans]
MNEKAIAEALAKYHKMDLNAQEIELVDRFEKIWPEYLQVKERVFKLSRDNRRRKRMLFWKKTGGRFSRRWTTPWQS